jgi:hypothetical protein
MLRLQPGRAASGVKMHAPFAAASLKTFPEAFSNARSSTYCTLLLLVLLLSALRLEAAMLQGFAIQMSCVRLLAHLGQLKLGEVGVPVTAKPADNA